MRFREEVVKALLPHITLSLAQKKPIHGYALIQHIRKKYGVYLSPSTIYPLLNALKEEGYVESEWQIGEDTAKPRKTYRPTVKGVTLLNDTTNILASANLEHPCRLY